MFLKEIHISLEDLIKSVRNKFVKFKQALSWGLISGGLIMRERMISGWTSPPRGLLKINIDEAVKNNESFFNIVDRNGDGNLIEAHFFKINIRDPMLTELWAVQQALMVCAHNRSKNIFCEYDAEAVVLCLKEGNIQNLHWSGENFLNDVFCLCNSFNFVSFS